MRKLDQDLSSSSSLYRKNRSSLDKRAMLDREVPQFLYESLKIWQCSLLPTICITIEENCSTGDRGLNIIFKRFFPKVNLLEVLCVLPVTLRKILQ
ncbi:hypothetical protein GQX74_001484 [Glossina fuscipes]|nr:hypothetical protein GQX74_001484 [Glossina fuscipes]